MDAGFLENLRAETLQRDHSRLLGIIAKTQNKENKSIRVLLGLYPSWSLIFILSC